MRARSDAAAQASGGAARVNDDEAAFTSGDAGACERGSETAEGQGHGTSSTLHGLLRHVALPHRVSAAPTPHEHVATPYHGG